MLWARPIYIYKCRFPLYVFTDYSLLHFNILQVLNLSEKRYDLTKLNPKVWFLHFCSMFYKLSIVTAFSAEVSNFVNYDLVMVLDGS